VVADAALGDLDLDLDRARLTRDHRRRADRSQYVVHLLVAGQQQRGESNHALLTGPLRQQARQRGTQAPALPRVDDRHRGLSRDPVLEANETRDADGFATAGIEGDQSLVIVVVDLGQVAQLRR
jgi:hypothetical protein